MELYAPGLLMDQAKEMRRREKKTKKKHGEITKKQHGAEAGAVTRCNTGNWRENKIARG